MFLVYLHIMTGREIYNKLSQRDYSGSDQDQYAQLLYTIHFHAQANDELDAFYSFLESSERLNKKLSVSDFVLEEIFMSSIELV